MTVGRRSTMLAAIGLIAVFAIAFVLLRPVGASLSDEQYVAIARTSPQGQLYFQHHDVPCTVIRAWTVQVNCDYAAAPGKTEKFRVYIDARTGQIVDTDMSFDP